MRKFYTYILLSLVVISCKKKPVETIYETNAVQFFVDANIDGYPLLLEGGRNDYYQYTSYSYNTLNGTYQLEGTLRQVNGSGGEYIKIIFYDTVISPVGVSIPVDRVIYPGDLNYYRDSSDIGAIDSLYTVSFNSENQFALSYLWTIDNHQESNVFTSIQFANRRVLDVELRTQDSSGSYHYMNNQIDVECNTNFSYSFISPDTIRLESNKPLNTNSWSFSDGRDFIGDVVDVPFSSPVDVTLTTDSATCSASFRKRIVSSIDDDSPNFNFIVNKSYMTVQQNYGTVEVIYFDGNKEYTSGKISNLDNMFSITDTNPYINNGNDEQTIQFGFNGKVDLINGSDIKTINFNQSSFGVAYP